MPQFSYHVDPGAEPRGSVVCLRPCSHAVFLRCGPRGGCVVGGLVEVGADLAVRSTRPWGRRCLLPDPERQGPCGDQLSSAGHLLGHRPRVTAVGRPAAPPTSQHRSAAGRPLLSVPAQVRHFAKRKRPADRTGGFSSGVSHGRWWSPPWRSCELTFFLLCAGLVVRRVGPLSLRLGSPGGPVS